MFLKEPHCALICGQTGCGKTVYLLDLLETEYKNFFDAIVIFCPTYKNNRSYQERKWLWNDSNIEIIDPQDRLDECLAHFHEKYKKKHYDEDQNILFIIDDCASSKEISKKNNALTKLAFSGRHDGISVFILAQKYNSICKDFREQLKCVIMFNTKDRKSFFTCLEENDCIPKEKIMTVKRELRMSEHNKVVMITKAPYKYLIC